MLNEIFKALLITSLAGSCLAAIITIAKPITKKIFGYSWHYYIWLAVLFVMILPVRFNLPKQADIPSISEQTIQFEQSEQTTMAANAENAAPVAQVKPSVLKSGTAFVQRIIDNRLNILAYLWLIGAIMLMLVNLIGYIRLIIKMRKNSVVVSFPELMNFTDKRVMIRVWENTSSPFMTGIFRPTLVLPARELTEEHISNILRHEMTHFKRHDILYKWFVSLVKRVHWFNPVIWYVAKQINTECEISCDMAVTQNMNRNEEMSYIDTVLSLLPTGKTKQIPLTTQMASGKRVLKRRFEMIRNKRRTSKFVSALSAVIAVAMLGTTVFASGALSGLTNENYVVKFSNNVVDDYEGEFQNKAFVENGEVYMPLRELFEIVGVISNENSKISWNNGKIDLSIAYSDDSAEVIAAHKTLNDGHGFEYVNFILNYAIEIGKPMLIENLENNSIVNDMNNAPILRNGNTYIPYSYVDYMLNGTLWWDINYSVYDKSGNLIDRSGNNLSVGKIMVDENNKVVFKSEDLENSEYEKQKTPFGTAELFFRDFHRQDFENMKTYCTENCVNYFFEKTLDGYQVFGMKNASIKSMSYADGSSETSDRVFLDISLYRTEFEETSIFAQNRSPFSFCLILQRQPDGRYLIDEFATGL